MHEKAEVELSQAGKQKLEKALIEMECGQTEEFDSVDDLIEDLARNCRSISRNRRKVL